MDNGPGFDGNARGMSAACCRLLLEFGARLCCKLLQICNSGGDSRSVYAIVSREGAGPFLQDLMQGEVHSSLLMRDQLQEEAALRIPDMQRVG